MRSVSVAPDYGQVAPGHLSTVNYPAFEARIKKDLAAAGVGWYFLALDVSLNHVKGHRHNAHWQLHAWGLIENPSDRDALKQQIEQRSTHRAPSISPCEYRRHR
jgi:hypothetical protein